ncbi:urate oxidase [Uncinocarpus reesii 1704]|uniref:Uricase n=1 Tax=Uncinocarpus reesii (strain UAMH 1704) TaxID=336963 RepID=C4JIY5_UNCRE|nr:urate oxidase [Uncinocarpus reesii 1704]EEP76743.1 urate oxidase [Uncinocarpus reesii 1704]
MATKLAAARYGKENVKVCKVHRDAKSGTHEVTELTVAVSLEGDIESSYTKADNSVVVATDSMKNTIYLLAKQHSVTPPELFASIVGTHFIETYNHIHAAHVRVVVHRWTRMNADGKPHPHAFLRDGTDVRVAEAYVVDGKGVKIKSSISGLLVLKSTGSQFHGFIRDEYTTLPETWDRILSTEIDASWIWAPFVNLNHVRSAGHKFDQAFTAAREISLNIFAQDDSASVQNTMYKMASEILSSEPLLQSVSYSLPNKHYLELGKSTIAEHGSHDDAVCTNNSPDLSWHKGLKNTGANAEVYIPSPAPNGLIQCTISRENNTRATNSKL